MSQSILRALSHPTEARHGRVTSARRLSRLEIAAWSGLLLLLIAGTPVAAETFPGTDIQLHAASILPAASPLLGNPSGTLRLQGGALGYFGADHSTGSSGMQLQGGLVALPEPAWGPTFVAGIVWLLALRRRRVRIGVCSRGLAGNKRARYASLVGLCLLPLSAGAQVPQDMAYQGRLSDAVGAPLEGSVHLEMRVFEAPAAGTPLYAESHKGVSLDDEGTFSVRLGAGMPTTGSFDASLFKGLNRYLELVVDGQVLSPRQPLGSVPWALMAADVVIEDDNNVGAAISSAQTTADTALAKITAIQEIVQAGWPIPDDGQNTSHATTADHATDSEHATTADHASHADYAAKAGHATTADHASTANHAIKADHAAMADYANAAATAAHATRADTAATAETLSPNLCSEGQILWKGPMGWECIDLPSAAVPIFAMGSAAPMGQSVAYAIGEANLRYAEGWGQILPRDGFLSDLVVSPRDLEPLNNHTHAPIAGTVLVATVVVNGSETTLSVTHTFDTDGMNLVSNTSDRIPVRTGDTVIIKFEETGGVCTSSFNPQTPGTCGHYRAAFLLE